ncbi:MAG: aspartyl protease family protein, partial [Marinicella sp.]
VQANHLYLKKQVVESSQAAVAAKQADLRQLIRSKREFEIELGAIKSIKHEAFFLTTKASINNVEGLFVIDSGAGRSILHQAQLIKYQIDPKKIDRLESSSGAGGDFGLKIYSISDFEMSHIQLTKDQIAVSDLTSIVDYVEQETGVWVDGFLGQDLLAQHGAVIDVSGQKMYLHTNNPD